MKQLHTAILGSGNIGTDLMFKIHKRSSLLKVNAMIGIDPESEGLGKARSLGITVSASGIDGLLDMPELRDIDLIFDATSAGAHQAHHKLLTPLGKRLIDLTPAAVGPYTVPVINGSTHLHEQNINMVTCGGQATIPIVAAINSLTKVHYAEIVASIASLSAGPGTRANIDEFTETTARAIETVGGASRGKAIIVLNPASPPMIMRDTIYCLCDGGKEAEIHQAIEDMVEKVQQYVPGYRLKQSPQFDPIGSNKQLYIPEMDQHFSGTKVSVFLEVEGAGDYLPPYAGNLDIMTAAALWAGETIAAGSLQ